MKTDDPKFTAFALDQLDDPERSEIEALLREDPALNAEVAELRRFAANLRRDLQAEQGAPLSEEQRAALLGGAPQIIPLRRVWWRQTWLQSAAAACVILGVSAVMLSQIETRRVQLSERGDLPAEPTDATEPEMVEAVLHPTDAPSAPVEIEEERKADVTLIDMAAKTPQPVAAPAAPAPSLALHSQPIQLLKEEAVRNVTPLTASAPAAPLAEPDPAAVLSTVEELQRYKLTDPMPTAGTVRKRSAARPAPSKSMPAAGAPPSTELAAESAGRGRSVDFSGPPETVTLNRRFATAAGLSEQLATADLSKLSITRDEHEVTLQDANARDGEGFRGYRRIVPERPSNTEAYESVSDNGFLAVKDQPLSTFSVDVDTASYSNVRRFLNANQRPPKAAVRIEELVNYFRYDYPQPDGPDPFSCALEVATCPWQSDHRLVRIGLKGKEIKREARPEANLVFLVDVSGSMAPENRLPLVRSSLKLLVDQLNADDSVGIVVYAGASGCVLEPTSDKTKMRDALSRLEAGGSTNGGAGIQLAYELAQRSFKRNGINRVILCTDGDFNVGITNQNELVSMIQTKAKSGVFLSVLGFGMGNLKDSTLEKLADNGNGNYAYIDTLNEGRRVLVEQMSGTLITIAKDVKVQVEFNPAQVSAYRLIGYENRLLAREDFNNDAKDAGEIGAGHTVTALYQVVPIGKAVPPPSPGVDDLKYQKGPTRAEVPASEPAVVRAPDSSELLTVKLRYKQPDGETSKKLEFPLTDNRMTWEQSSRDFRWAASVAGFGMLLRDSPHKGSANWSLVEELAIEGKSDDREGYRAEFVGLVEKAKALGGEGPSDRRRYRAVPSAPGE